MDHVHFSFFGSVFGTVRYAPHSQKDAERSVGHGPGSYGEPHLH